MVLQIILFIVSASLDNFIVGLSYGVKKIQIDLFNNLIIAFLSGAFTLAAMLSGKLMTKIIPLEAESYFGSGLLILLGIYFIFSTLKLKYRIYQDNKLTKMDIYDEFLRHPEMADADNSSTIDPKESLILGIALSMNNFGLGIGASIVGLNIIICSLFSFIFSIFFIQFGYIIGDSVVSKFIREYAELISGIIIILLGIYTFLV